MTLLTSQSLQHDMCKRRLQSSCMAVLVHASRFLHAKCRAEQIRILSCTLLSTQTAPEQGAGQGCRCSAARCSKLLCHVQVAADIKEATCRTSDGPFQVQDNANIPTVSYEVNP